MPFPTSPAPPGERRGGTSGERLLATGPGRGRTHAPERHNPHAAPSGCPAPRRGRGGRTRRPPPSTGTQRRRRQRTSGGGGQGAGAAAGPPVGANSRRVERAGGPGSEETRRGRARQHEEAAAAASVRSGAPEGRQETGEGTCPPAEEPRPERAGRAARAHRPDNPRAAHGVSPPAHTPGARAVPRGPGRAAGRVPCISQPPGRALAGDRSPPPHRRRKRRGAPEPSTRTPRRASPATTARPAGPPPHPVHAREGTAARPRPVSRGGRPGGGEEGGTTPPGWRARRRPRGAKKRGEKTGEKTSGTESGRQENKRGPTATREGGPAPPATPTRPPVPAPEPPNETRRPATTGWSSTRRDAPGLQTPACNATPRAGRVPRPGPLQLQGPLAHHAARGTLPGGPRRPRPGPAHKHAGRPPARDRERAEGHSQRARGKGGRGPSTPGCANRAPPPPRAHARHQRPTQWPHVRQRAPARPSGNPPPTRRGEARAAVGTKSRRSAPTRGGPADPCLPRRREGGDSRLHTPPTVA
ncbi:Hypothetical predicted protein [Marmota monax]|uniref:Uncharacterized protein n=1 Tax=Marmota monax TaxID=9995 RepID=A0A5E4D696_MARMO|nr:Hypothetical predicted protein [Marmota monax]